MLNFEHGLFLSILNFIPTFIHYS